MDTDKAIVFKASSVAAFALEILIDTNPGLYDTLRASRSDISHLAQVEKIINSARPRLYDEFQNNDYELLDFVAGLQQVLEPTDNQELGVSTSYTIPDRTAVKKKAVSKSFQQLAKLFHR